MANIPITDNTTLLNTLKTKAQSLPNKGSTSGGGGGTAPDLSFVTATASDILAGKKGADTNGNEITGTMTNRGKWDATITSNGTTTIPSGYHNGSGQITVNVPETTVANGTLGTPTISVSTSGKITATSKVTTSGYISSGTTKSNTYNMSVYLGGTAKSGTTDQTISLAGKYCSGNLTISGDSNLKASNIKSGVSILGVTGTYTGGTTNMQYRTDVATPIVGQDPNTEEWWVYALEHKICAIAPSKLLLTADPTNTITLSSDYTIVSAYHDVVSGTTYVTGIDYNGSVRHRVETVADGGVDYIFSNGYVNWIFYGRYFTTNSNSYVITYMM